MAITYLTGGAAQRVSGSVTVSVTVGGTDQFMISCLATQGAQTISTATFDGTPLTQILEIAGGTGGSAARLSVDCLVLGTTSKTADWDQVVTGISGSPGGVSVYEGVDQSTPYRTAATDSANTDKTSVSLSPTSAVGDVVVDFLSRRGITEDVTPDGSQTERWQQSDVLSVLCFSSDLAGSASSTTMGCSWASGAQRAVYAALALIPAAAGGVTGSVPDSLTITDTTTNTATIVALASDSLALSDTSSVVGTFVGTVSDSIVVTDEATGDLAGAITGAVPDAMSFTDTAAVTVNFVANASDSLGLTDTSSNTANRVAASDDSLALTDLIGLTQALNVAVNDLLNLTETLTGGEVGEKVYCAYYTFMSSAETAVIAELNADDLIKEAGLTDELAAYGFMSDSDTVRIAAISAADTVVAATLLC